VPDVTYYGTLADYARGLAAPAIFYLDWTDFAIAYLALAILVFCIRRGMLRFAAPMRLPTLALFLLALLVPTTLSGVWGANFRVPCFLAFLAVSCSDLRVPDARIAFRLVGTVAVLLLIRVATLLWLWPAYDADFRAFRSADAAITPGSRVLALPMRPADCPDRRRAAFPYFHVAALAVPDRDVFLPSLFTFATPVGFATDHRDLTANLHSTARPIAWQPAGAFTAADAATVAAVDRVGTYGFWNDSFLSAVDWNRWPEDFDYLIEFTCAAERNPVPALLTEVARGGYFSIFRIHPPGG
jgi:hypothetical protein